MSNLYARRLFSEHPIAMWAFDDKVSFIDHIDASNRDMTSWTLGGNTLVEAYGGEDIAGTPFTDLRSYTVYPSTPAPGGGNIDLYSDTVWTGADVKADVPISASAFVYITSNSIDYIEFGSTDGVSYDTTVNSFPEVAENVWVKISHLDMQYEKLYMNIVYKDPASGFSGTDYDYVVNGLVIGQYSEPMSSDSSGVTPVAVPVDLSTILTDVDAQVVEEKSFGIDQRSAYHVVRDNELLSYNSAMPLVYGSNYLTRLRPAPEGSDHPSFIFDGCGMFTEQGRYDTYTLEFWIRVSGNSTVPRKIVGPAISGNTDGLYICGSIMTLSIGNKFVSYNVGRLGDPMLIHLIYTNAALTLMINGETVAEVPINASTIELPDETNQFLGFYSYSDLGPIEIDVVSIFGYAIPGAVAKRRFVWGQGVGEISLINSQYQGDGAYAGFSSANYTNSISYPDNTKWVSGNANNLDIVRNKLTSKEVALPTVFLSYASKETWLSDLNTVNVSKDATSETVNKLVYFNYCPTNDYVGQQNYTLFNSILRLCKDVDGFSVAAEFPSLTQNATDLTAVEAFFDSIGATIKDNVVDGINTWANIDAVWPIFRINNRVDPRTFIILYAIVNGTDVTTRTCYFSTTDQSVTILDEHALTTSTYVSLVRFSGYSATNVGSLFARLSDLEIVLGSDQVVSSNVNIHSFGLFDTRFYNQKIKTNDTAIALFDSTYLNLPLVSSTEYDSSDNTAAESIKDLLFTTYTYLPKQEFGYFYEDIGVRGTWEDYVPLSTLAGVVQDFEGNEAIGIDSIQYNISFPAPKATASTEIPVTWTYDDLSMYYANLGLGFLYLGLFTGYSTYDDLRTRTSDWDISDMINVVDTSDQMVKSYVAVQESKDSIKQLADFSSIMSATQGNTVYFSAFSDYTNTLFEVYDGAILIPPRNKETALLALLIGVEYDVPGVITYPVEVKSLELASYAKNRNSFTPIKSISGKDITPFVYNGVYYDNSAFNPFKIDKRSFPYLYLGKESGFTPMGAKQEGWKKGMQLSMPQARDTEYKLDNLQFWIRRGKNFPTTETTFLEFRWGNYQLNFTIKSFQDDNTRGVISVYDRQGIPYINGTFLQNGNATAHPVVELEQWNSIQFAFEGSGLAMSGSVGYVNLYPGFSYNNISYFATRKSLGSTQINYRSWQDVSSDIWTTYYLANTWGELLIEGTATLKVQELSSIIYNTYIGTSAIQIDGSQPLRLSQDSITSYSNSSWSSITIIPV